MRRKLSSHFRAAFFRDKGGICAKCTRKIAPGEEWAVDHVKALGLGGADDESNFQLLHVDCHKPKTAEDRAVMADADRALLRHVGLKKKSRWPKQTFRKFG